MARRLRLNRDRIAECMNTLGLPRQKDLADASGLNADAVSRFLNGYKRPGGVTIPSVLAALTAADTSETTRENILLASRVLGMEPADLHRGVMFARIFEDEEVAA